MSKLCLLLGVLLPSVLSAASNLVPAISREATKCAAAWQREDLPTAVAYMPARVVQQLGGRTALLKELKEQYAQARQLGAQELELTLGSPSSPQPVGPWLVAVVPITAVVHSAYVDLIQDTHALALSADRGKRWSFVLLYGLTQPELNAWFPEFRGRVRVPVTAKPRLTLAN